MQLLAPDSVIPEYCRKPVLVLGCGNVLFGDDGLGPAVVERLLSEVDGAKAEDVCLLDVGTAARKVLFTIALSEVRPRCLLVVDAVDVGKAPGEVFTLSVDELPATKTDDFSMHQIPTSNLLRELRDACGVAVEIVSCQVGSVPETVCPGLSDAVLKAVPEICRNVWERVDGHAHRRTSSSSGQRARPDRPDPPR